MDLTLLGVGGYVLLQLLIGLIVSRRVRTETDYVLAGRSFGYGLATMSIFATWFGAETCIGSSAEIYHRGLSAASQDPFGYALCILLMGAVLAAPLWRRGLVTLADLFRHRYSPGVERLAVLMMVPTSVLWAAAQIRAFGQVLSASSTLTAELAITLAAGVVIAYTVVGGLLADAVTDVVQGGVLVIGLMVVFFVLLGDLGGLSAALGTIESHRLRIFRVGGTIHASILHNLEAWLVPICGSVVAQELVARVLACRSPRVARRSAMMATGLYLTVGAIPLFFGLVGPAVMPDLEHAEHLLPRMIERHAAPWLYIVFAGALVSAILSTVDSALLAASTLTTENLIASVPRLRLSQVAKLRVNRCGVVLGGAAAYLLALHGGGVFDLVHDASAFGSAGIFTLVVFGLFSRRGGSASAYSALVAGMVVWLSASYLFECDYPYVLALGSAITAYALASVIAARLPGAARS